MDALRLGNRSTNTNPGRVIFGEADNRSINERVKRTQVAFQRARINYETPPDMLRMLWWKFMAKVGMNPTSAVLRAPCGAFQSSPDVQALTESMMREVMALIWCAGITLDERAITGWYVFLKILSLHGRTSMLQDVEARRRTEIDLFSGQALELGKTIGIPTPVDETLLRAGHVLERYPVKND